MIRGLTSLLIVMGRAIGEKNQHVLETYILWKNTPLAMREPRTKGTFAKKHGVSEQTLGVWDKLAEPEELSGEDEFKLWMAHLRKQVYADNCPVQRQQLYSQLKGYMVERKEVKLLVLTADDIIKAEAEAKRELGLMET